MDADRRYESDEKIMPKIEVYTPQVRAQIPGQQRATPADFGAGVADAMRGMAATQRGNANFFLEQEQQSQELEWHKTFSDFQLESMKRAEELAVSGAPAGKTLVDVYSEDFDARSGALNIPNTMKERARKELDNMRVQYIGDGVREQARRAGIAARENWESIVNTNANIVALNPGMQDKALTTLATAAGGLRLDPETRKALFNDAKNAIRGSAAESLIRSNPSGFVAEAKAGKWNDVKDLSRYLDAADREIERNNAGEKQDIREAAGDVEQAANMGISVPRETIDGLAARADAVGMEREAKALRDYGAIQEDVGKFAVKSVTDQAAELDQLKTKIEGGDISGVDKYQALAKVYDNKARMLQSDPWQYYSAHKIVHEPEPINISDPKAIGQAFTARKADIARVRELEGGTVTLPLLTKNEIGQIKEIAEKGKPEQAAAVFSALGANLDSDEKRSLAQAVATQGGGPLLAAALNQPQDVAVKIMAGATAKGEVPAAKIREKANEFMQGSVLDPEANEAVHDAIYAYYKSLSMQAGDTSKEPDADRVQKAIEDVVGKVVTIDPTFSANDSTVFSYRDDNGEYVDDDRLEDILGSITDEVLMKTNGALPFASDGAPVKAKDILSNARFVSVGDGLYTAVYDGLGVVSGRDGRPYVFDARKLEKAQK